ncbi:hypothetical protein CsSME_00049736 [Camellia sinensis var. sinensis]
MNDPKQALKHTTFSKSTTNRVKLRDRTDSTNRVTNSTQTKSNQQQKQDQQFPERVFGGRSPANERFTGEKREVFRLKEVMRIRIERERERERESFFRERERGER